MERKQEILDAAFEEFSEGSYGGTTIDRIAARAGLSKAGIYAHFHSKDEIFEALMAQLLLPSPVVDSWVPSEGMDLATFVDHFLDHAYAAVKTPAFMKALRLIMNESERAPELLANWHDSTLARLQEGHEAFIEQCVAKGLVRAGPFSQHFWSIAMSPLAGWIIGKMIGSPRLLSLDDLQAVNKMVLMELLEPR